MSEIDQQFIEYVVKSLVGKPDAVKIDRRIDEKGVLLELTVDPEDLGRVIGKRGATAQSLRTLLRALGTKNDARYNLKIIDNGTGAPSQARDNKSDDQSDDSPAKKSSDDTAAEETATVDDEPVTETAAQPAEEEKPVEEEDQTSDRLKKAREELADLDDLDV
jgi:predicted RNA-binding protein YlqC (UPF0109 family)